ncbi:MAG: Zn-ribbon domain-containing OB-fold protein [Hyphomicrobiaceae bacterium]
MSKPSAIVTHDALAAAESQFVAPELVENGPQGPRLVAGKCGKCGALSFPKAAVCPECLSEEITAAHLASEGMLYSFAVVHQAPKGWTVPYALGYVDLPDGIRVLAHIEGDAGALEIDSRVRLDVGRVGTDADGNPLMSYVFKPEGDRT